MTQEEVTRVETPDCKSIDEVAAFLNVPEEQTIKTLLFIADDEPVVALLVGNDQVNDVKLKNYLAADFLEPATEDEARQVFGANFGSLGPVNLPENVRIVADRKVQDVANAVVGANEDGYHLTGVNPERDFKAEYVDIREVKRVKFLQTVKVSFSLRVVSRLVISLNLVHVTLKVWVLMFLMKMAVLFQLSWDVTVSVLAVSCQL